MQIDYLDHIKMKLIEFLIEQINATGCNQVIISKRLNITQPRLSHLMNKRTEKFSTDALLKIASTLGFNADVILTPKTLEIPK